MRERIATIVIDLLLVSMLRRDGIVVKDDVVNIFTPPQSQNQVLLALGAIAGALIKLILRTAPETG